MSGSALFQVGDRVKLSDGDHGTVVRVKIDCLPHLVYAKMDDGHLLCLPIIHWTLVEDDSP